MSIRMPDTVVYKWNGKDYTVATQQDESVASLKRKIESEIKVLAKRQKILGLKTKAGRPASDEDLLSNLALKAGQKLMLMG